MRLIDRVQLGKRVTDANGFVSVPAVITMVGIQQYHVTELMRDESLKPHLKDKSGLVNVFRPPETVFNPLTIDSFKNLPVTVQHPDGGVSTTSAKFVSSGHIGSDVDKIDSDRLGATIHLHDADAIDISRGSETSAGYDCPVIYDSGEHEGTPYDFRFDGPMIGNHLALVPAGRCGEKVKVLDKQMEIEEMDKDQIVKLVEDKVKETLEASVPAAIADAISKIDIGKQVTDAVAAANEQAKKDADEAAEQKKLDDQKKADAAKQMQDRVVLHAKLSQILDEDYDESKTDHELMVLAVGDTVEDADSKSDEYLTEKVDEIAKQRKDAANLNADSMADSGEIKLRAF
jgi:hypothetical protein